MTARLRLAECPSSESCWKLLEGCRLWKRQGVTSSGPRDDPRRSAGVRSTTRSSAKSAFLYTAEDPKALMCMDPCCCYEMGAMAGNRKSNSRNCKRFPCICLHEVWQAIYLVGCEEAGSAKPKSLSRPSNPPFAVQIP